MTKINLFVSHFVPQTATDTNVRDKYFVKHYVHPGGYKYKRQMRLMLFILSYKGGGGGGGGGQGDKNEKIIPLHTVYLWSQLKLFEKAKKSK